MPDQIISSRLDAVLPSLETPDGVHRLAMSYLPDLGGRSKAIRADLGVLFRLSLPTDIDGSSGRVAIRFRAPFEIDGAETLDAPDNFVVGQRFTARVVAEKRHEDDAGRGRSRPVLDEEAKNWAESLLARHGVEIDNTFVSERWRIGQRGARAFWVRDLTATIANLEESCSAYVRGIGRGKAFGYGMPIVLTP